METRTLILAAAVLAAFAGEEAALFRAMDRIGAERDRVDARIRVLRREAQAQEIEAASAEASARGDSARTRRLADAGAPNHGRILRILKALEAAKFKHGPSDPRKLDNRYAHAGIGVNAQLMSDPDYADRARFIGKYDAEKDNWLILRQLGAAGVDTGKMASLLAELMLQPMEAQAIAKKEGLSDHEANTAAQSQFEDVQTQIQQFLGPENEKLYNESGAYANGSFGAGIIDSRLSYAAAPMDDRQYLAMATLFGGHQSHLFLEGRVDPSIAPTVQTILTPDQFAAFEDLLREQKAP